MADDLLVLPNEASFRLMKPLVGFKGEIQSQLERFPFRKNVFLMLKFRDSNRDLSDFICETLGSHDLLGVRADDPQWNITQNVYNPLAVLYCCKYGIALFDEPEPDQAYSPNVAYELGIMHYQRKRCLILRHDTLPPAPFDLIKDLYETYSRELEVRPKILTFVQAIADAPSHSADPVPDVASVDRPPVAEIEAASDALHGSDFAYKVLRQAENWWHFSWKVDVANRGSEPTRVRVRVQYYDSEGFPLDYDTQYPDRPLEAAERRTIVGDHRVGVDLAVRVNSARVFIKRWG